MEQEEEEREFVVEKLKKKYQSLPLIDQRYLFRGDVESQQQQRPYASLGNDELMKYTIRSNRASRQQQQDVGEATTTTRSEQVFVDSAVAGDSVEQQQLDPSYIPYENKLLHEHRHRQRPHMHSIQCDRLVSAYDLQRERRYYFTNSVTPVRVYIKYDKQLNKILSPVETEPMKINVKQQKKNEAGGGEYVGQKLNLQTLRFNLGISKKFLKDASNMLFIKETLSFIPTSAAIKKQQEIPATATTTTTSDQVPKSSNGSIELQQCKSPDDKKMAKRKLKLK